MMKVVYCIRALYNPGGMERVLLNKVSYLVGKLQWDITVVTTDQKGRPAFYPFPSQVKMVDLGINYADDNHKNPLLKIAGYLRRRRRHRRALTELLMRERPDVVVSLYPSESSFIPSIDDGSKKVLELHYSKFFRIQYGRKGLLGMIDRWRTHEDEKIVGRFDRFVVLTNEDRGYWGDLPNMEVIPNAAMRLGDGRSDVMKHRVLAVGRLDYQKGFDRLICAWELVQKSGKYKDIGSMYRPMTKEERELLQRTINISYEQFLSDITKGRIYRQDKYKAPKRYLSSKDLRKYADGRIFTGEEARDLGFVDALGGLEDAHGAFKQILGKEYPLINYSKPSNFSSIFSSMSEAFMDKKTEVSYEQYLPFGVSHRNQILYMWE